MTVYGQLVSYRLEDTFPTCFDGSFQKRSADRCLTRFSKGITVEIHQANNQAGWHNASQMHHLIVPVADANADAFSLRQLFSISFNELRVGGDCGDAIELG